MPLLDHFHAPLFPLHPWESFHGAWADALMAQLNQRLPARYFATFHTHLGTQVEADVAEFEQTSAAVADANGARGGTAVAAWAPPRAALVLDALFPDDIEVQVLDTRDGAVLVAVVELVSPGNKDRPQARRAFAAKCAAYLQRGIGLVVADIVTNRQANLHHELLDLLRQAGAVLSAESALHAAAYRPVRREERSQIEVWPEPLAVGQNLPVLPLWLRGAGCVPLDLEAAYMQARERSRL